MIKTPGTVRPIVSTQIMSVLLMSCVHRRLLELPRCLGPPYLRQSSLALTFHFHCGVPKFRNNLNIEFSTWQHALAACLGVRATITECDIQFLVR
jgi:hypothetical protein